MFTKNDVAKVLDTILSSPGMGEMVRVDLRISRKNVLLLSSIIDQGLKAEKEQGSFAGYMSDEGQAELKNFAMECLQKAGLVELSQKLADFSETGKG